MGHPSWLIDPTSLAAASEMWDTVAKENAGPSTRRRGDPRRTTVGMTAFWQ